MQTITGLNPRIRHWVLQLLVSHRGMLRLHQVASFGVQQELRDSHIASLTYRV